MLPASVQLCRLLPHNFTSCLAVDSGQDLVYLGGVHYFPIIVVALRVLLSRGAVADFFVATSRFSCNVNMCDRLIRLFQPDLHDFSSRLIFWR